MRKLIMHKKDWMSMQYDAEHCAPEEACGLVGGRAEQVSQIIPIINELHSPVRFRMLPEDQLKAMLLLEDSDLDLLAVYHSHPSGPAEPSQTDLKEFFYPGAVMIIWFREKGGWDAKGYEAVMNSILPVSLTVLD
jgi:proteasome lid subunit RPN8/RPN11